MPLDGYPRVCAGCGGNVRITKDQMTQHCEGGVKTSWHTMCWLERAKGVRGWKPAT